MTTETAVSVTDLLSFLTKHSALPEPFSTTAYALAAPQAVAS
jgi:hypothetical protein